MVVVFVLLQTSKKRFPRVKDSQNSLTTRQTGEGRFDMFIKFQKLVSCVVCFVKNRSQFDFAGDTGLMRIHVPKEAINTIGKGWTDQLINHLLYLLSNYGLVVPE